MIRGAIGLLITFFGLVYIVLSEMNINMSAAEFIGSTGMSRISGKQYAIGLVLAMLAIGFLFHVVKNKAGLFFMGVVTLIGVVSGGFLTLLGQAVDYEASEHHKTISKAEQSGAKQDVKNAEKLRDSMTKMLADCDYWDRWDNCTKANAAWQLAQANKTIKEANNDFTSSKAREKVNISDAILKYIGISPILLQKIVIFTRAACATGFLPILSFAFWHFWAVVARAWKKEQNDKDKQNQNKQNQTRRKPTTQKKTSKLWLVK